jgi:PAS domain S-box-containing protein
VHIAGVLFIAALIWNLVPNQHTIIWVVAVTAAAVTRSWWRVYARRRELPGERALAGVRLTVLMVGLAWGIGAMAMIARLPFGESALILVVLAAIVAGGTTTLVGDRATYRCLLIPMLALLPLGFLLQGDERTHIIAVVYIVMFTLAMDRFHARGNHLFTERVRATALLQRSSEQLVRQHAYLDGLLASAPVAIVIVDGQDRVRRINPQFERLFGYSSAETVGRTLSALIFPEAEVSTAGQLTGRARRGETVVIEVERRRKDGTLVPVRLSARRVEGLAEDHVFAMYEDVGAEVASREALRQARDAAERLAQTRSTFLANMSHEIRTPLNAILGMTELLLDTELTPDQRHSLSLVEVAGENLLALLNNILDLSKIQAEQVRLESIPFSPRHLVETTIGLLALRAGQKKLELLGDVAEDVPPMVRGDPTRLRQVLTNLIGNAIKFTESGEIVVTVHRVATPDGRPVLRFAVRDTGVGIPAGKLETIFQEFGQADESTTRKYGGTGLGLTIARRLMRLMEGDLTVTSVVGRGTEFTFAVPLVIDAAAPPTTAALIGHARLAGRRVLVVDDSAANRRVLRGMLDIAGLDVTEAADGAAGLAALRRVQRSATPYDLAIIDGQMPGLDGFALGAAVRAEPAIADTRLLMLTSSGRPGDGARCLELGINAYLTKPASRTDLLDAVSAVLGMAPLAAPLVVTQHSIAESRRRLQILLAEDNVVNQEVAARMLRKRGHDVDVVGDGRAAVEAVARKRYDVVLMDIQMPEMDGFEATTQIRATSAGRDVTIIALTAHALTGERAKCLAHGMNDYLTKPFKGHDLFALVEDRPDLRTPAAPAASAKVRQDAPVDLDSFRRAMREAGIEDAVDGILDLFVQAADQRIAALNAALATGGAPEIKRAAHAFKSSVGTIGATRLATLLDQIEKAAAAGDLAQARTLGAWFEEESAAVTAYLRHAREHPTPHG